MFINISVNLQGSEYEEHVKNKNSLFNSLALPSTNLGWTIRVLSAKHAHDFSTSHKDIQRE